MGRRVNMATGFELQLADLTKPTVTAPLNPSLGAVAPPQPTDIINQITSKGNDISKLLETGNTLLERIDSILDKAVKLRGLNATQQTNPVQGSVQPAQQGQLPPLIETTIPAPREIVRPTEVSPMPQQQGRKINEIFESPEQVLNLLDKIVNMDELQKVRLVDFVQLGNLMGAQNPMIQNATFSEAKAYMPLIKGTIKKKLEEEFQNANSKSNP